MIAFTFFVSNFIPWNSPYGTLGWEKAITSSPLTSTRVYCYLFLCIKHWQKSTAGDMTLHKVASTVSLHSPQHTVQIKSISAVTYFLSSVQGITVNNHMPTLCFPCTFCCCSLFRLWRNSARNFQLAPILWQQCCKRMTDSAIKEICLDAGKGFAFVETGIHAQLMENSIACLQLGIISRPP